MQNSPIGGAGNAQLNALANTLLEQDEDKIITEKELRNFVRNNSEEIAKLNISSGEATNELREILKDNMETRDNSNVAALQQRREETNQRINDRAQNTGTGTGFAGDYNKLKAQVEEYKQKLAEYDAQIDTLTKDTEALQKQLDDAIKAYNDKEAELISQNQHLEAVMEEINNTKENLEADVENQQKRAVWNAINDYDPEKDGDWNKYLQKACEGTVYSPLAAKLSSLVSSSQVSVAEIQKVAAGLSSLGQNVQNLSDKITENTTEINNLTALRATTQTALEKAQQELDNSILNLVSCEEMKLVEQNNLDLKEKLADGSPRYIIAKGMHDDKYHIYDMVTSVPDSGSAIARKYGSSGEQGYKGTNIVPVGDGAIFLNQEMIKDLPKKTAEVYYLTDCGMQSDQRCYYTDSPLAFDIDGDGYKLNTSETIKYDIDGDGVLDNINDSLDGVLVFDKDGDGISGEDGSETFGNNTDLDGKNGADGYKNGFEALKALRDKAIKEGVIKDRGDGKLNAEDLAALEKNYGLKMKTGGYNSEAKSLSDIGITEINVSDNKVSDKQQFDSFGNEVQTQEGATFKINGQENSYVDMWHRKYSDSEVADYDSIKNSNLSFNIDEAAKYATNAKLNVETRMTNILAQTSANESTSQTVGAKAKKEASAKLNERFWQGTAEPENFFMKKTSKTEKQDKIEAKKQEEKEAEEKKLEEQKIEEEKLEAKKQEEKEAQEKKLEQEKLEQEKLEEEKKLEQEN